VGASEEAEAAKPAVYSDGGVARCCVLEVDAVNCADTVLQAQLLSSCCILYTSLA
jgi:hypothetical protein